MENRELKNCPFCDGKSNGSETCVVCSDTIPEGRQVCHNCEKGGD